MLASVCVGDFAAAERYGEQAIAYCIDHDLDAYRWYLTAIRGRLALEVDDWQGAITHASEALRPGASLLTRIVALVVLGRVGSRRGDEQAAALLDEAFDITAGTGEPQRLAPVFAAHAEAAWLRNRGLRADVLAASTVALRSSYLWDRGEVAVWLRRLGHDVDGDAPPGSPFDLSLAGDHAAAHAGWTARG